MWRVVMKMLKVDHGDQVMLFLENPLLSKDKLKNIVPLPEANEVVVFKGFMKAGLRFPLHKMLVEVLKTFEIYFHQLTPEALIKVGVFIWAIRSQRLEPDAKCFCNIHELSFQTKATGKEQYHNNFGCYIFVPCFDARYPVPTFRKKWLGSWMK
jgi:hypothetical protein